MADVMQLIFNNEHGLHMSTTPGATLTTDIAIIGAGPVGLFGVFAAGMLNMKTVVIDSLELAGGQLTALYPEKPVFDIPGHPSIEAQELIVNLQKQAEPFHPVYLLDQQVMTLEKLPEGGSGKWRLTTSRNNAVHAKAIIIAAGVGAFGPNRPPVEKLDIYEASGNVHYLVKKREDFRGKKLVIAGGGDSAVDWVMSLKEIAARVAIVHRRDGFRAADANVDKMRAWAAAGEIDYVVPYTVKSLHGDGGKLTGVEVESKQGNRILEADHFLAFYGLSNKLGPIAEWGLDLDKKHIHVDPATCASNIPGIFAAGDIALYPGKLHLILAGFCEIEMACHAAYKIVHPDVELKFEYSSAKGVPGSPGSPAAD